MLLQDGGLVGPLLGPVVLYQDLSLRLWGKRHAQAKDMVDKSSRPLEQLAVDMAELFF